MGVKYFTLDEKGEHNLGGAGAAKRYLKAHPEIKSVVRWWWCGSDLIECEDIPRETLLASTVKQAETGATAQWAHDHYFAPNPGAIEGKT